MSRWQIRIPDKGETPLSLAEQLIAQRLGIKPKRRYSQRFAWREPQHLAPARALSEAAR